MNQENLDHEAIARELLACSEHDVPGMTELVRHHVDGGVYVRPPGSGLLPATCPASCTYLDPPNWGARSGWAGWVRDDLDPVAKRDALAWIVAAVTLAKRRICNGPSTYDDERRIARALKMPREPFLVAARELDFDPEELAEGFAVTKDEVLARLAELGAGHG